MANIRELNDDNFENETQTGVVLVDFYANWCGPCRTLAPVLEQVAGEVKGKASLAKVDIDNSQKTAAQFQITSIPTLILFKNGSEVNRLVGLKNADTIKKIIADVT